MSKKINNSILIKSGKAILCVKTNIASLLSEIADDPFIRSYIPNNQIIIGATKKADASLTIKKSKQFSVKLLYPDIVCKQPDKVDVRGLIVLIGYVLERINNERGAYSIHSSVIAKNGKAVVIFGGTTNLGKTSIAKTASEKFGWLFYSDEIALIDSKQEKIIAGGKIATNNDSFGDFKLTDTKQSPKIIAFIHPHIDNGLNKVKRWTDDKFFWHLKEELARRIRGGSKAINLFSYPLDSFDTFDIAKKRLVFAKKLATKVPCYEMRGTPESIIKNINQFYINKNCFIAKEKI